MPPSETNNISSPNEHLSSRLISCFFWGILSTLLVVYCGRAFTDPDFWWHLASGKVMLTQGKLLNSDPFNYTGDPVVHNRESVILKGYWLWQVTAALLYRIWGLYGLFVMKAATMLLTILAIMREMYRQSVSPFSQMVLIGLGSAITVAVFALERPQIFSFIFATTLIGMVSHIRLNHRPSWLLLPLMALWSNIHGGFVVGDILLVLFAAGAVIQYRSDRKHLTLLLCWAGAGIIASLANPNGWNTLAEVFTFTQQNATQQIGEYVSSWAHFKNDKLAALLWLIVALHGFGMVFSRRIFWPEIFISLFLIAFGLKYMRNEGFIAISLIPMTGWYLDQASARLNVKQPRLWQTGALIAVMTLLAWQTTHEWNKRNSGWPVSNSYPEKMTQFLQTSGLSGHLFNEYDMGGYLNWALYPQWQTFIDGRALDYRVDDEFTRIIEGGKKYEALLEQYAIDVVALSIRLHNGRPMPLLKLLLNNPRWTPVYLDNRDFVLVRNSERNSAGIKRFAIDKAMFINRILTMCNELVSRYPDDVKIATCYTELLIYAGKYREAEVMLSRMEQIQAGADMIAMLKRQIKALNMNN